MTISACMDIKITTNNNANMIRWTIGNCTNPGSYDEFTIYVQRCCLTPGQYTLTCQNTEYPDGWYGGYIEIQGHRYCDDFMAYKAMRRIIVKGSISSQTNIFHQFKAILLVFYHYKQL